MRRSGLLHYEPPGAQGNFTSQEQACELFGEHRSYLLCPTKHLGPTLKGKDIYTRGHWTREILPLDSNQGNRSGKRNNYPFIFSYARMPILAAR